MFEVGREVFFYSGKTIVDPGYTAIMPWQAIPPEEDLPSSIRAEQVCSIKKVCLVD